MTTEETPLVVEVESLAIPIRDFYETRDQLIHEGKTFDWITLMSIPYHQLYLACIGNAGAAMCSVKLVAAEKRNRRSRFMDMDHTEFESCSTLLQAEHMLEDVKIRRAVAKTPSKWGECSERMQAWFKLNCLMNHTDSPLTRVAEAIDLLKEAAMSHDLPQEVAFSFVAKIRAAGAGLQQGITSDQFRDRMGMISEAILHFLPDNERKFCEKEELADYVCTSNCYRVIS